jgi:hypothetical protein
LLILAACKLKVFGNDPFGKVLTHCKVGAGVINHILENNFFFPAGSSPSRLTVCAHALNEETFKAFIVDILQVSNDTNLQRTYIGELRASWD